VWVLPRFEAELGARLLGRFAAEVQEWPQQMTGSWRHPGQGSAAGATSQAKQHGFGLVIEGVAEQYGGGTRSGCCVKGTISGLTCRCFGSHSR
jgi:hypothetical protein